MMFLLTLFLGATAPPVRGGGTVLEPLPGKMGSVKLLVYVHGAFVNEVHYTSACRAIQNASSFTLWVGLPSFLADTPNPATIKGAVTGMVKTIVAQGKLNISVSDIFVAAHSLGGVFAPAVVKSEGYAGLLEFGSYVTQGQDITTTPYPVLTLGGELDGLTRVSRIALEYAKMTSLPLSERLRKPVVVLPGVCHSQFAEGVNVTSFGHHDLVPDVSWPLAHQQIAAVAADFLTLVVNDSSTVAAEAAFAERWAYTMQLVRGFLAARSTEKTTMSAGTGANWCAQVQSSVIAPKAAGRAYGVDVKVVSAAALATSSPRLDTASSPVDVDLVSHAAYGLNPVDVSTVPVAATSLTCEMMSADAIDLASGTPGAGGKPPPPNLCRAANTAAIESAESLVSAATLARFKARGQLLSTAEDKTTHSGVGFLASDLTFDSSSSPVVVAGVSLATPTTAGVYPGVYECILLSPTKAIEWMMVDGLPKLP